MANDLIDGKVRFSFFLTNRFRIKLYMNQGYPNERLYPLKNMRTIWNGDAEVEQTVICMKVGGENENKR